MEDNIIKQIATDFFFKWYNSPGQNTSEGFDKWWEKHKSDYPNTSNKDTERLDFLQNKTVGYGAGWVLRDSTFGRGMRLHESSLGTSTDVREAIDIYMKAK